MYLENNIKFNISNFITEGVTEEMLENFILYKKNNDIEKLETIPNFV